MQPHKKQTLFGAMGFFLKKPTDSRRLSLKNRSNLLVVRILKTKVNEEDQEFLKKKLSNTF